MLAITNDHRMQDITKHGVHALLLPQCCKVHA